VLEWQLVSEQSILGKNSSMWFIGGGGARKVEEERKGGKGSVPLIYMDGDMVTSKGGR
jgi:hypothetical protein